VPFHRLSNGSSAGPPDLFLLGSKSVAAFGGLHKPSPILTCEKELRHLILLKAHLAQACSSSDLATCFWKGCCRTGGSHSSSFSTLSTGATVAMRSGA